MVDEARVAARFRNLLVHQHAVVNDTRVLETSRGSVTSLGSRAASVHTG